MRLKRVRGSPLRWGRSKGVAVLAPIALCAGMVLLLGGCKAKPTELRGKTAFGPEFRNRGNNTSEIRYTEQQSLEMKWDNGWTTAVQYRRRDVDQGSGDNENRVLFEVGYPLWKAPPKPDKTSEKLESLEQQVQEMRAKVAALKSQPGDAVDARLAQGGH